MKRLSPAAYKAAFLLGILAALLPVVAQVIPAHNRTDTLKVPAHVRLDTIKTPSHPRSDSLKIPKHVRPDLTGGGGGAGQAPQPPTNLTTSVASGGYITLKWTASTGAASYIAQHSTDGGTTWQTIGSSVVNTIFDNSLSPSTTYAYRVAAVNASGQSAWTSSVNGTTQSTTGTSPSIPTSISVTANSGSQVFVNWVAGANDVRYSVQRSLHGANAWYTIYGGTAIGAVDTGLAGNTAYDYQVEGVSSVGSSGWSTTFTVTTPATNSGTNLQWVVLGDPFNVNYDTQIWTVNAGSDGTLYVGADAGIVKSTDGGATWTRMGTLTGVSAIGFNSIGEPVCGTSNQVNGVYTTGIYRWHNNAWVAGSGATASLRYCQFCNDASGNLYVCTAWAGDVYKSTDNGSTYTKVTGGWSGGALWTIREGPDGSLYTGGEITTGIWKSSDGGNTWTDLGLLASSGYTGNLFDVAFDKNGNPVVAMENNTQGSILQHYVSGNFSACAGLPSYTNVHTILTDQSGSVWIGIVNTPNTGGLYQSTDNTNLSTWQTVQTGLTTGGVYSLAQLPNGEMYCFVGTGNQFVLQALAIPQSLTANAPSSSQINLAWIAVPTATGYTVQRSANGTTGWTTIATPATNSYSDTGLTSSTTYYYRVFASFAVGTGANSAVVSGTTQVAQVPSTPSNVVATVASNTEVNLTWTRNSTNETSIIVQRQAGGSGPYTTIATLPAGTSIWTDTSCFPSTAYTYQVSAANSNGQSGAASSSQVTTTAPYSGMFNDPTNPSVSANSPTTATFSYTDTNASITTRNYLFERSDDGISYRVVGTSTAGNGSPFQDSLLTPGHTYLYRCRVADYGHGVSNYTAPVSITMPARTAGYPIEPSGTTVVNNSATSNTISWTNNDGSAVKVERATWQYSPPYSFTQIAQTSTGATSYTDTGVSAETSYVYRIRTTNATGNSDYDKLVMVTTASPGVGGVAHTYDIGPGYSYTTIGSFPWSTLGPGDTVNIHAQANQQPYYELLLFTCRGTAAAPITVNGVADGSGNLPILDGTNAVQNSQFQYAYSGIAAIGGITTYKRTASPATGAGYKPGYVVFQNLQVQNFYQGDNGGLTFTDYTGAVKTYNNAAMGFYLLTGDNITVKGCKVIGNGEGIFCAAQGTFDRYQANMVIDSCTVGGNGNKNSTKEHNIYMECLYPIYQYNYIYAERSIANGGSLKDRSVGAIIRYNEIHASARILDLVETQNMVDLALPNPDYHTAYVYGNLLVNDNTQTGYFIHYGNDTSDPWFSRKGVCYVWGNTMVNELSSTQLYHAGFLQPASVADVYDVRNNILICQPPSAGGTASELDVNQASGIAYFGTNWISQGWQNCPSGTTFTGNNAGTGNFIVGTASNNPGFTSQFSPYDFRLTAGSPCINAASGLPGALSNFPLNRQYVPTASSKSRPTATSLGAFEYGN